MRSLIRVSALPRGMKRWRKHPTVADQGMDQRPQRRVLRRLVRNRLAQVGTLIVACLLLASFLAPWLAPYDPLKIDLIATYQSPSSRHLFGTDELGRDIVSRVLYGSRTSLLIAVVGVFIALGLGLIIGPVSGYFGGLLDRLLMRLVDILSAFPSIILAILIISIAGTGIASTMVAIGVSSVPTFARLARGSTISLRNEDFVLAAQAVGATNARLLRTHIVPNLMTPLIVQSTLRLSTMVLTAAGLSFIGLGVQPPNPELGTMMSEARSALRSAPHAIMFPGIVLMLIVLGFNIFGDGLRDSLDPRDSGSET